MKKIISKRKNRWHLDFLKIKRTKTPFFATKEPFRAKKIFSFNIIIILIR